MEGEPEKEVGDGWAPGSVLSTLGEQLIEMHFVIDITYPSKEAAEQKKLLDTTATKLLIQKGQSKGSSGNWGIIFRSIAREAKKKEGEAGKMLESAGLFSRQKHKKEQETQKNKRIKYNKFAGWWELAKVRMKKEKEAPPPYTPVPTAPPPPTPPASIYPVLEVTGGILACPTEGMPPPPALGTNTKKTDPPTPLPSAPFQHAGARYQAKHSKPQQVPATEERSETTYRKQSTSQPEQGQKPETITICLKGNWQPVTKSLESLNTAGEELADLMIQAVEEAKAEQGHENREPIAHRTRGRIETGGSGWKLAKGERDDVHRNESEEEEDEENSGLESKGAAGGYPLIQRKPGERPVYQPYTLGDITGLVHKLPNIHDGAHPWLVALEKHTAGVDLALGDIRAILTMCSSKSQLLAVERDAGTLQTPNEVPIYNVLNNLNRALRQSFPLKDAAGGMTRIKWDRKQNPPAYLDQAIDDWTGRTGQHPGTPGPMSILFRKAVLKGVPEATSDKMEDNPDLQDCDFPTWKKHLLFNLNKCQDKDSNKDETVEDLQQQLLRMQIQQAKKELGGKPEKPKLGIHFNLPNFAHLVLDQYRRITT
ncbi:uncharacterized protein LOC114772265 [Denticeps clupeoides]|uniref:uncharacterized protein LOC114772265 n=1 Tax=Denticeps clupeoides TaxID=299321 RepID=UPI0010A3771F|nr:uncharacterized protein LOC114772265 [Denticeps clupeoides]